MVLGQFPNWGELTRLTDWHQHRLTGSYMICIENLRIQRTQNPVICLCEENGNGSGGELGGILLIEIQSFSTKLGTEILGPFIRRMKLHISSCYSVCLCLDGGC